MSLSRSKSRAIALAALAAAYTAFNTWGSTARADVIADWTFETNPSRLAGSASAGATFTGTGGAISADVGTGTASGMHAGASTYSAPSGNGSVASFSSTDWATGDFYEFDISSADTGIQLSFDQTGSATGPKQFQIEYNIGSGWVNLAAGAYNIANTTTTASAGTTSIGWSPTTSVSQSSLSFDLSSLSGLTGIRIVDMGTSAIGTATAIGTGGTIRVDNVLFTGTSATPEPTTVGIVAAGAAFMIGRRRRR